MKNLQLVWFKRDLRIHDHAALSEAAKRGPVLPLYIIEPALWAQADVSSRHYDFLIECLKDLNQSLTDLGQPLIIRIGEAVNVLSQIHQEHNIEALWSHMETWNMWSYQRDLAVKAWAKERAVPWHEPRQFGVIRRIKSRDGWAAKWDRQMGAAQIPAPQTLTSLNIESQDIPSASKLKIANSPCTQRQKGRRAIALEELQSFLYARGEYYQKEMSSPVTAYESCSRISPYISFGSISMRETYQAALSRAREIKSMPPGTKGKWPGAMRAFTARLHWHCHFMQKLEDEPEIEFHNMHRDYDGIREPDFNDQYFEAWKSGQTGYPIIDASMRALHQTGWINFRMRAMLVSFASYHLWLHWRKPSLFLAQQFLDYEPGIHYCQHQMQSGVTGINAIRIYSPIKQAIDQDPDGTFIKHWIPELRDVPLNFLHKVGHLHDLAPAYPKPIIHEASARKEAADKIYAVRKGGTHRQAADAVMDKHGSRKSGMDQSFRNRNGKGVITLREAKQGELPF